MDFFLPAKDAQCVLPMKTGGRSRQMKRTRKHMQHKKRAAVAHTRKH
jgi:hypothetical protein